MKRFAVSVVVIAALAAALTCAPEAGAATPPPAADLVETFSTDPRPSPLWDFTGAWTWDAATGSVVSPSTVVATSRWLPGQYYAGTLAVRLKLLALSSTGKAVASIVFAANPATGASRWVRIVSGSPGSVTLGQTGTIGTSGSRTIATVAATIPLKTWLNLSVTVGAGGAVTVKLGSTPLITRTVLPFTAGKVGFAATKTKTAFDSVAFRGNPDAEPCRNCHAGQPAAAPAPDVYRYWDGTWWDTNHSGSSGDQQGGHGDPGGLAATVCTGTNGCHDMRLPAPGYHRNGKLEPDEGSSANSFHMRAGFINSAPVKAWDVQMTFDNYCYTACHSSAGVPRMKHSQSGTGGRPYLRLGLGGTEASGVSIPEDYPLDHDITTAAPSATPRFAPCVTCHDPHGADSLETGSTSNRMLRLYYRKALCVICHI